jgi:glycosyltransferase involved in cell wall biosynthesis
VKLSVAIITFNEETNIARTLKSVIEVADEIVIVDSGSTDLTMEIAQEFGPKVKVFAEGWKGFAAQKNSAIEKCNGEWILSLDADEEVSDGLRNEIAQLIQEHQLVVPDGTPGTGEPCTVFSVARRNMFMGRWLRRGGLWPDRKIRLFQRGTALFEERPVHETIQTSGPVGELSFPLHHHAYPTLSGYLEHMNRYSSLGAETAYARGATSGNIFQFLGNVVARPKFTFLYNYLIRGGFLDGREGLLHHLYHAVYVSWKYAKAWEMGRKR